MHFLCYRSWVGYSSNSGENLGVLVSLWESHWFADVFVRCDKFKLRESETLVWNLLLCPFLLPFQPHSSFSSHPLSNSFFILLLHSDPTDVFFFFLIWRLRCSSTMTWCWWREKMNQADVTSFRAPCTSDSCGSRTVSVNPPVTKTEIF